MSEKMKFKLQFDSSVPGFENEKKVRLVKAPCAMSFIMSWALWAATAQISQLFA